MKDAPETPLLPLSIGYKGQSIQFAKQIKLVQVAQKLAQEIGADLQNPADIPNANTLSKFSILARVIRTMSAKQIEEAGRQLFTPHADQHSTKSAERQAAWKAFRDACAEAGTGPAVAQVMAWVQDKNVQGEEAAQLISTLPKTIRTPTSEMMKAFYVSIDRARRTKRNILNSI